MTRLLKTFGICLPITLALTGFTSQAEAACARKDIDYYLSKGFTTEQITTMCSSPAVSLPEIKSNKDNHYEPDEPMTTGNSDEQKNHKQRPVSQQTNSDKTGLFLIEAIKGRNVILTDTALQYTQKVCIKYGEEDMLGFTPKACPQVRFEISLEGLEVLKSGKKYLFYGDNEIYVKGTINRKVIEGLDHFKSEERERILEKLEAGNETAIPVRDDIPLDDLEQLLKQLAF